MLRMSFNTTFLRVALTKPLTTHRLLCLLFLGTGSLTQRRCSIGNPDSSDQEARFHTLSGWLIASRNGDRIEMDFPALFADRAELPMLIPEDEKHSLNPRGFGRRR